MIWYLNDTFPIKQPRCLLIQGWHNLWSKDEDILDRRFTSRILLNWWFSIYSYFQLPKGSTYQLFFSWGPIPAKVNRKYLMPILYLYESQHLFFFFNPNCMKLGQKFKADFELLIQAWIAQVWACLTPGALQTASSLVRSTFANKPHTFLNACGTFEHRSTIAKRVTVHSLQGIGLFVRSSCWEKCRAFLHDCLPFGLFLWRPFYLGGQ